MKIFLRSIVACLLFLFHPVNISAQHDGKRFHVLVLYENGGHHIAYSKAAVVWLNKLAADSNFSVDYINNTSGIDTGNLKRYQLFIQLDYPPYNWTANAMAAFRDYMEKGKGGWIGFHHASLLGEFDGFPMWQWFSDFMGGIRFKNYIPDFADATVTVENIMHPVMKGVPTEFLIEKEEWYTYDKTPRPNVQVIARVNESSYQPASTTRMGDHPVIWSNPAIAARNIYIFMGHSPDLFKNEVYRRIFQNAIFWTSKK